MSNLKAAGPGQPAVINETERAALATLPHVSYRLSKLTHPRARIISSKQLQLFVWYRNHEVRNQTPGLGLA